MGSCNSCEATSLAAATATAKLILHDGRLLEFSCPIRVAFVAHRTPSCFVCNSDDLDFDGVVSALRDDDELLPGQLYFELPLNRLKRRLDAAEMAALAVKASAALARSGRGCEKCEIGCGDVVNGGDGGTRRSRIAEGGRSGRRRGKISPNLRAIPEDRSHGMTGVWTVDANGICTDLLRTPPMATSSLRPLLFIISACLLLLSYVANPTFRPRALVIPVTKDASTQQYLTRLRQRTPLVQTILAVDLGAQHISVNCERGYDSSFRSPHCRSSVCNFSAASPDCFFCFGTNGPDCNNNTCATPISNPFTVGGAVLGQIAQDTIAVGSGDGRSVVLPRFIFVCGNFVIQFNLAATASGFFGLGSSRSSTLSQFAAAYRFPRKFAVCLPSTAAAQGVIFVGYDDAYKHLSRLFAYTPLQISPAAEDKSDEYFIGVKSIAIGGRGVKINTTLLTVDENGNGGTKISTRKRFTVLEPSIYRAFTSAFVREAVKTGGVVPGVAPFEFCYRRGNRSETFVAPDIDLALDGGNRPIWRITAANSMVQVNENVACLGFVDGGGAYPVERAAIVIGGLQMEGNLLEFDIDGSRLGFGSGLARHGSACSGF